jgi:hypothetical protein
MVAIAFGSYSGHPRWNSTYDLNGDYAVDIIDICLLTRDFGRSILWGVVVSDTAWNPWGSYFAEEQIGVLKELGSAVVRIMLDKKAWDDNDMSNVLGTHYPNYIKALVDLCKPELKVVLDLTLDSSMGNFSAAERLEVIMTPELRSEWISWGKTVIAYCRPDAIGLMSEPPKGLIDFDHYYDDFVIPSMLAYRSVDPNITMFVMSKPHYDLAGFFDRPLDDPNTLYEYHIYYDPSSPHYEPREWELAYVNGDLQDARSLLYNWLDETFGPLPKARIIIGECGVRMEGDETIPSLPNWDIFLRDLYAYVKRNHLLGLIQYGFTKQNYLMLDPQTGYTALTEYGEFFAEHCP